MKHRPLKNIPDSYTPVQISDLYPKAEVLALAKIISVRFMVDRAGMGGKMYARKYNFHYFVNQIEAPDDRSIYFIIRLFSGSPNGYTKRIYATKNGTRYWAVGLAMTADKALQLIGGESYRVIAPDGRYMVRADDIRLMQRAMQRYSNK